MIDRKTFDRLREIVYEKSGINLTENKKALVTARLNKRLRALGLKTHKEYLEYLLNDKSGNELIHMIDVISTNVTRFFRESDHFDFLKEVFVRWVEMGQRRFRMWSAGCSSGEEPYSMAMVLLEALPAYAEVDLKILATDISTKVLEKASEGVYEEKKVMEIPRGLLSKYFVRDRTNGEITYSVSDRLKRIIVFRRLNLAKPPFPMKGPLDVIFCRNVMIYFDKYVRENLLKEFYRLLKDDGYLFLGHSESITGIKTNFRPVRPSIYTKV